jgi:hypothetical protein
MTVQTQHVTKLVSTKAEAGAYQQSHNPDFPASNSDERVTYTVSATLASQDQQSVLGEPQLVHSVVIACGSS